MRTSYRALSVEAVEDRSLPSTFLFIDPGYGHASHGREATFASDQSAGYSPRGNGGGFEEVIFRSQSGTTTFVFINNSGFGGDAGYGGFQLIPIFVGTGYGQSGTPTPTPLPQPTGTGTVGDGGTSSSGGNAGGDFGPTPAAPTHAAGQATAGSAAAFGPGAVAALLGSQNTTNAAPAAAQQTANAAQVAAAVNGQPAATLVTAPTTTTHAGYAITATATPDADAPNPDDAGPRAPTIPLAPAPVPMTDTSAVGSGIVTVAAAAVAPVAGFVPFDVATLSTGANQFLDRVADLTPAWPDSMPGFTDSLWVAAAALLTGGAVHAAAVRSAPRSADAVGRANALSEWERRNGRVTG